MAVNNNIVETSNEKEESNEFEFVSDQDKNEVKCKFCAKPIPENSTKKIQSEKMEDWPIDYRVFNKIDRDSRIAFVKPEWRDLINNHTTNDMIYLISKLSKITENDVVKGDNVDFLYQDSINQLVMDKYSSTVINVLAALLNQSRANYLADNIVRNNECIIGRDWDIDQYLDIKYDYKNSNIVINNFRDDEIRITHLLALPRIHEYEITIPSKYNPLKSGHNIIIKYNSFFGLYGINR